MSDKTKLQAAEEELRVERTCIEFCRLTIRDAIYSAYMSGKSQSKPETEHTDPPTAAEVNKAISALEEHAVKLKEAERNVAVERRIAQVPVPRAPQTFADTDDRDRLRREAHAANPALCGPECGCVQLALYQSKGGATDGNS